MARRATPIPPLRELVDSAEAVRLTHYTRRHLYRLTADGLLPVYKAGPGKNLYWVQDLQNLVSPQDRRVAS